MSSKWKKSLVALGGNLPLRQQTPVQTLSAALCALSGPNVRLCAVSRFFRTPCFPAGAGPDYVNAAVVIESDLEPGEILLKLHDVEQAFARSRTDRWGTRTLDLDLIASGDSILPDQVTFDSWRNLPLDQQKQEAPDQLILPHPRLQDRAFVLVPLADIAPHWRHPVLGETIADLLAKLPKSEVQEVVSL